MSDVFKDCVDTWGEDSQLDMVVEECLELALEVHRRKRGRTTGGKIADELADVIIITKQLSYILGEDNVQNRVDAKIKRTEERLIKWRKDNE